MHSRCPTANREYWQSFRIPSPTTEFIESQSDIMWWPWRTSSDSWSSLHKWFPCVLLKPATMERSLSSQWDILIFWIFSSQPSGVFLSQHIVRYISLLFLPSGPGCFSLSAHSEIYQFIFFFSAARWSPPPPAHSKIYICLFFSAVRCFFSSLSAHSEISFFIISFSFFFFNRERTEFRPRLPFIIMFISTFNLRSFLSAYCEVLTSV